MMEIKEQKTISPSCEECEKKDCEICETFYSLFVDGVFEGNYDSQIEALATVRSLQSGATNTGGG